MLSKEEGGKELLKAIFLSKATIRRAENEITNARRNEEVGWVTNRQARDAKLKLEAHLFSPCHVSV